MCRDYFLTFRKTNIVSTHVTTNILIPSASITSRSILCVVILLRGINTPASLCFIPRCKLKSLALSNRWRADSFILLKVKQRRIFWPFTFHFVYAFNKHSHKRTAIYPTAHSRRSVNSVEEVNITCWAALRDTWYPKHFVHKDRIHCKMEREKVGACSLLYFWHIKLWFSDIIETSRLY